jgi:transporter family-2 protein
MGILATINGQAGRLIGPFGTGLVVNVMGGMTAGIVLVILRGRLPSLSVDTVRNALPLVALSGMLGIATLTGIAFSVARIGTAAGLAGIIAGQMLTAAVIDSLGVGTSDPIPLNAGRIAGLLLFAIATWLLLPPAAQS